MRVAGKAGRGRGAGVSRRGPAPSLTILPNQSGEIRLTANLLDTRRRFAPPTKNGGEREEWRVWGRAGERRNGYGQAGRFAWRRIFGIRGDASRRQRKMAGSGRNGGYKGKGWRGAERVRRSGKIRLTANLWIRGDASRRQRKGRGARRAGASGSGGTEERNTGG